MSARPTDLSVADDIVRRVAPEPKVIGILAPTYARLEREVAKALRDVAPERVITISYAVSRILGVALQHHVLIVLRSD